MPKQLLHFMWSNTVTENGSAPFTNLDLDELSPKELQYHLRLSMMHSFGISHRLKDYSKTTLIQLKNNIILYKSLIRPFVSHGDFLSLYLLDYTNVFSFVQEGAILIFLFAEKPDRITLNLSNPLTYQ